LACGKLGVDADYSIKSHYRIGSQNEVLRVSFLGLVRIVKHGFLMEEEFGILGDVL
jgi:hypothetical protein